MSDLLKGSASETVIAVVEDLTQDWGLDLAGPIGPATTLAGDLQIGRAHV
jgi:hypothetical protein